MSLAGTPAPDPLSASLEAVITKFAGMLRSVGWRYRLSEADLDELLQQVRIRLWRAQGSGEQIGRAPASYVYRTAVSAALDMMRRRRAQRVESTVSVDDPGLELPAAAGPGHELESSELAAHIAEAIE